MASSATNQLTGMPVEFYHISYCIITDHSIYRNASATTYNQSHFTLPHHQLINWQECQLNFITFLITSSLNTQFTGMPVQPLIYISRHKLTPEELYRYESSSSGTASGEEEWVLFKCTFYTMYACVDLVLSYQCVMVDHRSLWCYRMHVST